MSEKAPQATFSHKPSDRVGGSSGDTLIQNASFRYQTAPGLLDKLTLE
jgi:hypothetical protein